MFSVKLLTNRCYPHKVFKNFLKSQCRHNEHDGVSNHRRLDCLINRLFRHINEKRQSCASLAFVRGIQRSPVNSTHNRLVTRKCFHLMTSSWIQLVIRNIQKCNQSFNSIFFSKVADNTHTPTPCKTLPHLAEVRKLVAIEQDVVTMCSSHLNHQVR